MELEGGEQEILMETEPLQIGGVVGGVTDVLVNDESVVEDGVANIVLKTINDQSITGNGNIEIDVPTQTSDLENNSGFITNTVDDLTNYYTKSQTYSQTEINNLLSGLDDKILTDNYYEVDQYTQATGSGYSVGDKVSYEKIKTLQQIHRGNYFLKYKDRVNVKFEFVGDSMFADMSAYPESVGTPLSVWYQNLYQYVFGEDVDTPYDNVHPGYPSKNLYEATDPSGSEASDVVFISVGTNDAFLYSAPDDPQYPERDSANYTPEKFIENLIKIFCKYVLRGAFVVYCSTPTIPLWLDEKIRQPWLQNLTPEEQAASIGTQVAHEYGRMAKRVCELFGIPVFDSQQEMSTYAYSNATIDGLHYTQEGEATYATKLLAFTTGRGDRDILRIKSGISTRVDNFDLVGAIGCKGVALTSTNDNTVVTDTHIPRVGDIKGAVQISNINNKNPGRVTIAFYAEENNLFIIPKFTSVGSGLSMLLDFGGGCNEYVPMATSLTPNATSIIMAPKNYTVTDTTHTVSIDSTTGLKTISNALFVPSKGFHTITILNPNLNTTAELIGFDVEGYNRYLTLDELPTYNGGVQ